MSTTPSVPPMPGNLDTKGKQPETSQPTGSASNHGDEAQVEAEINNPEKDEESDEDSEVELIKWRKKFKGKSGLERQMEMMEALYQTIESHNGHIDDIINAIQNNPKKDPREIRIGIPEPFDGTAETAETWISAVQAYLGINEHVYNNAHKQIAFALSLMKNGQPAEWAADLRRQAVELVYSEEDERMIGKGYGTWDDFIANFRKTFDYADGPMIAMNKLLCLQQTSTIEDYNTAFRNLAYRAGIREDRSLILQYQRGLKKPLLTDIYRMRPLPSTIQEWYAAASQSESQWKTKNIAIGLNQSGRPSSSTSTYRRPGQSSSSSMEVHRMELTPEKAKMFKEGLCFICKKKGHIARKCPDKKPTYNKESRKIPINCILGQASPEEREEIINELGFVEGDL